MAQLSIYLPDEINKVLKAKVKAKKTSTSKYLADLIVADKKSKFTEDFWKLQASLAGLLEEPEELPQELDSPRLKFD